MKIKLSLLILFFLSPYLCSAQSDSLRAYDAEKKAISFLQYECHLSGVNVSF
jgi:hypothetical protein